ADTAAQGYGHHQIGGRGKSHLVAVLGRQITEGDRQMRLADAAGAAEHDVPRALDKSQAGELVDLRPAARRWRSRSRSRRPFSPPESPPRGREVTAAKVWKRRTAAVRQLAGNGLLACGNRTLLR